jgi:hypothetical protein
MLESMSATDWEMWQMFYATLPDRTEHYLSQLCAMVANANFKRPDKKPFKPADFRPDLRTPTERLMASLRFEQAQAEFEAMQERARVRIREGTA